jgi:uncharacterized protein YecE (DUF72 family)
MKGQFRIGTSNIVIPGNKLSFPPEFQNKSRLHYYSTLFNSLEVNSSFYKIPLSRTFARWAMEVTPGFHFTLKLWKGITHNKNLVFEKSDIDHFLTAASALGENKGCLLLQFPGSISSDYADDLKPMLKAVKGTVDAAGWRLAVELRNDSWYRPATYRMLNRYKASLVLHDKPKSKLIDLHTSSSLVYLRFHGPRGDYRESYTSKYLEEIAERIRQWLSEGKDVYAYFNNTMGAAFENAQNLQRLVLFT